MFPRHTVYSRRWISGLVLFAALVIPALGQSVVWYPVPSFPEDDVESILFTDVGTMLVSTGVSRNWLYRSTDKGATWSTVRKHGSLVQAANGDVLAFARGGLIRSIDDGVTWGQYESIAPNSGAVVTSVMHDPSGSLYVGPHMQGALRSTDDGYTWQRLLDAEKGTIYDFECVPPILLEIAVSVAVPTS